MTDWRAHTLQEIAQLGELDVPESMLTPADNDAAHRALSEMIAFLIDHRFEKLLWILYRIDVDEAQAKKLLAQHLPEEAPGLLATLILQREEKKQAVREQFNQKRPEGVEDDLLL